MAARADTTVTFNQCLGSIETLPAHLLPDGFVTGAINVEMSARYALKPRAAASAINIVSGPAALIRYGFSESTSAYWAFTGTTPTAYRNSGGWSTVSLPDTAGAGEVHAVGYNGKVFLAYNSSVNRLHVWTGAAVRRVGLGAVANPTVADFGAGSYPATIRYYRAQQAIFSGTTRVATSELGASQAFTPSGTGQYARVTKPATVDSATHWRLFGSADDVTFFAITDWIANAQTAWDDGDTPATYSAPLFGTGELPPSPGFHVPPPSCRFLATNGERVFMAGAFETSASSGETTPSTRRVWFTRPLGSTDEGDDEAITQTGQNRYYLDIENGDNSPVTGLCSALDGTVYVFTETSAWRLFDTGDPFLPIRAERIVSGVGAYSNYLIATGDPMNASMVYFMAPDGPYRWSPATGLEWLGEDWVGNYDAVFGAPSQYWAIAVDPVSGLVAYTSLSTSTSATVRVLDPSLMRVYDGVLRGGWGLYRFSYGVNSQVYAAFVHFRTLMFGGQINGSTALIFSLQPGLNPIDDGNTPAGFTASLTTKTARPTNGLTNFRTEEPYFYKPRVMSVSCALIKDQGGSNNTVSGTVGTETVGGSDPSTHRRKGEGLVVADAYAVGMSLSYTTLTGPGVTNTTEGIDSVVIPVIGAERG